MRIVLCPTLHEHDREVSLLERLVHGTTDGGLLILPEESSGELQTLMKHGFRFVVVDPRERHRRPGPDRLRRELLRRRPGDATPARTRPPPDRRDHGPARVAGHRGAHTRLPRGARRRGHRARRRARDRVELRRRRRPRGSSRSLLDLPEPPTAIFAFNDQLAIGAMQAALARGLRDPATISRSSASTTPPRRSSSRPRSQPSASRWPRWAAWASACSIRLLDNRQLEALHVELATQLIVRGLDRESAKQLTGRRQPRAGVTRPVSYANTTICTRSRRSSLERTRRTCDFTVASDSTSCSAISALERLRATSSSTSRSRAVS